MLPRRTVLLHLRVVWELIRYDALFACLGFRGVRPKGGGPVTLGGRPDQETAICQAICTVTPFYWKPIRCLQRSIITARIMRSEGIPAEVVIGYRPMPFFGHAWVEVNGRVANDSPTYKKQLQILERL